MSRDRPSSAPRNYGGSDLRILVVVAIVFVVSAVSGGVLSQAISGEDGERCVDAIHRYGGLQGRAGVLSVFDVESVDSQTLVSAFEVVVDDPGCFPEELVDRAESELQKNRPGSERGAVE